MASNPAKEPTGAEEESSFIRSGKMTEREAMDRVTALIKRLNQEQEQKQAPVKKE